MPTTLSMRVQVFAKYLTLIAVPLAGLAPAEAATAPQSRVDSKVFEQAVAKAVDYLRTKGQAPDGSYSKQSGPAITALVTTAILRNGRGPDDPVVAKSLKYLSGFVRDDGGIYSDNSVVQNYETCLALMCFVEANRDGRYTPLIKNAEKFLKLLQWDGSEGHDNSSEYFGGAGYGGSKRPDLSNTSFLIDALRAAGGEAPFTKSYPEGAAGQSRSYMARLASWTARHGSDRHRPKGRTREQATW